MNCSTASVPYRISYWLNSFGGSGHALDHIAVRIAETGIIFEKITVGEHVCDDQLILNKRIAVEQEGIAGIGIDDQLVNFAQTKIILHLHFVERFYRSSND